MNEKKINKINKINDNNISLLKYVGGKKNILNVELNVNINLSGDLTLKLNCLMKTYDSEA